MSDNPQYERKAKQTGVTLTPEALDRIEAIGAALARQGHVGIVRAGGVNRSAVIEYTVWHLAKELGVLKDSNE